MINIKATKCQIEGLCIIKASVIEYECGYLMETYNQSDMAEAGLNMLFVQDNQSMSIKGVGYQKQFPQVKLVWVIERNKKWLDFKEMFIK